MPERVTVDARPPPRGLRPSALALHLDCSRAYIGDVVAG